MAAEPSAEAAEENLILAPQFAERPLDAVTLRSAAILPHCRPVSLMIAGRVLQSRSQSMRQR